MAEQSLDEIMSSRNSSSETTAAPAVVEQAPAAAPAATGTGDRDDKGRFAPKAPGQPGAEPSAAPAGQQSNGQVPIQALDAERNRRKETEERHERELRELRAQLTRMQPAQEAAPQPKKPEIWEDPNGFIQSELTPVQQQIAEMREELWENKAVSRHTPEVVSAAKEAAEKLFGTPQGAELHRRITASGNPFDNLVAWHKEQTISSETGGDLEAYKKRVIEEYLAAGNQPQQLQPSPTPAPAALPTSFAGAPSAGPRGGPEYGGPRPLSEIMKR
ncbi:hypothetical protein [Rhizobium tumorigenes]|uniref:Scaffolding protein n=1 Tax=Rhizobium tumorigenes TaxID=2041385 RepID=A0AAF1KWI4_9HYPH|nr:hypothetical protein [Rhizobium tumorigenes]WFR98711.1 hypothetical protein PR017_23715 [Rhizobium tumorigenes]